MSDITVGIDGFLYKDNIKIPFEFGNLEQINAINKHNKKVNSYKDGTHKALISYVVKGHAVFVCLCGRNIEHIEDASDEGDIKCFDNTNVDCRYCKRKYHLYTSKHKRQIGNKIYFEDSEVLVKLK